MFMIRVVVIAATCALVGCVTTGYPTNPEDQARFHVAEAKKYLEKGDTKQVWSEVNDILCLPTGDVMVRELFLAQPRMAQVYLTYLKQVSVDASRNKFSPSVAIGVLRTSDRAALYPEPLLKDMIDGLSKAVAQGVVDGTIPFDLDTNITSFPELDAPRYKQAMFERSLDLMLNKGSVGRNIPKLIDYVERAGKGSTEWRKLEASLPALSIRRNELVKVGTVYPSFAKARLEELTVEVFLEVKGDRLMADDLKSAVKSRIKVIDLAASPSGGVTTVAVERIRHDEKSLPERTQTVTYAQHQVDTLKAVMLMPRNSSYIYDVVSGGAQIEYGYVVAASSNGKTVYEEVVRGRVGGEYSRCQNQRIQNVFGGINPADFIANDDMAARCNSGSGPVSLDELRTDVMTKIVDAIKNVPSIKAISAVN